MNFHDLDLKEVFHHELAPVPTSIIDDREMRMTKTTAYLKKKLQLEQSTRIAIQLEVVIIDGCAVLWIIHWPSQGIVQSFVVCDYSDK